MPSAASPPRSRSGRSLVVVASLGAAVALLLVACLTGTSGTAPASQELMGASGAETVNKVIYRYIDASVPPKYHRSYTITATPGAAHLAVDSHGEVLAQEDIALAPKEFDRLVKSVAHCRNCAPHERQRDGQVPCTGGTTEVVTTMAGDRTLFSGRTYHCGQWEQWGDLCGDVGHFASPMKALFPNLKSFTRFNQ
eukprot:EG_transcript_16677